MSANVNIGAKVSNVRRRHKALIVIAIALGLVTLAPPAQANHGREWKASYNSALSLREAAIPKVYKVGSKVKVCYRNDSNCLVVTAVAGSCTCFDISDEAFRKLAGSTSKGIITVSALPR